LKRENTTKANKKGYWNVFDRWLSKKQIELCVSEDLKNASPHDIIACFSTWGSYIGCSDFDGLVGYYPIGISKLAQVFAELPDPSIDIQVQMWERTVQLYVEEMKRQQFTKKAKQEEMKKRSHPPDEIGGWWRQYQKNLDQKEEEEQPFSLDVEELFKTAEEKRQERLEQEKADKAREKVAEEEGRRLALQDQLGLDAEIEYWASSIDKEEVKRWVSEDLAKWQSYMEGSIQEVAEDMIKREFDDTIGSYSPKSLLIFWIAGTDPPDSLNVGTHGGRLAMEPRCSSPLLSAAASEEDVDWISVEFKREFYNDIYLVKGRLRKMKELYTQVLKEMGLLEGKMEVKQQNRSIEGS